MTAQIKTQKTTKMTTRMATQLTTQLATADDETTGIPNDLTI
jgi:hypothetical protein